MTHSLILASAGAGKSSLIVDRANKCAANGQRVLILTYTKNNQEELVRKFAKINNYTPSLVTIKGWFSFLLQDIIRPYQRCIFEKRISGICFNSSDPHKRNGKNIPGRKEKNGKTYNAVYYLNNADGRAHTTYLSKLATKVNEESGGKSIGRLSEIYGAIFVDEVQDLTGWDFEVLEYITKADIEKLCCVGDFRQTIYTTHITIKKPKNSVDKIDRFRDLGLTIERLNVSWRCNQKICNFADLVHSHDNAYSPTESKVTGLPLDNLNHQGIFVVRSDDIYPYLEMFNPIILRHNRNTQVSLCQGRSAYNFGEAKGLEFDRVLICTTDKHEQFLSGNLKAFNREKTEKSKNAFYVAITRARFSVAFLYDGMVGIEDVEIWNSGN